MTTPELNPADLECIPWPPEPKHGMLTGQIPRGWLVKHRPTGISVIKTEDRNSHRNRAAALAELAVLVERLGEIMRERGAQ